MPLFKVFNNYKQFLIIYLGTIKTGALAIPGLKRLKPTKRTLKNT